MNLCISNVTQSIVLQFVEKLKKHIWFFCRFSSENVTIWNGPVNIHLIICVTVIIYFLALYIIIYHYILYIIIIYHYMKDGNFMNRNFIFQIFLV